jgi:uncharacterized protein (TIGR00156 family)
MKHIHKFISFSVLAASSIAAVAQGYDGRSTVSASPAISRYTGPSLVPSTTAKQLLENGIDDQYAVLNGKLVRHAGGKDYVFSDSSGEILVEISPKYFPAGKTVDANTLVQLTGKFDKERFGTSKLEVKQPLLIK